MADIITDSELALGTVFVTDRGAWTSGTVYETNDIVHTGDGVYMSLVDNNSSNPSTDKTKWRTWVDKTDINEAIVKANNSASICIMDQFEYAELVGLDKVSLTTLYLIKAYSTSQLKRLYYGKTLCEIQKESSSMECTKLSFHGTENETWIDYVKEDSSSGKMYGENEIGENVCELTVHYVTHDGGVSAGDANFIGADTLRKLTIHVPSELKTTKGTYTVTLDNIPLLTEINVAGGNVRVVISASAQEVSGNSSSKYVKKLQLLLPNWSVTADGFGIYKDFD